MKKWMLYLSIIGIIIIIINIVIIIKFNNEINTLKEEIEEIKIKTIYKNESYIESAIRNTK